MGRSRCENLCDDGDLDEFLAPNAGPVVIDVWSSESGPCRAAFEVVAREFADRPGRPVKFGRLQADRCPALVDSLPGARLNCFPTVLLCLDGVVQEAVCGRLDAKRLSARVRWLASQAENDGFFARLFGGFRRSG